MYYIYIIIFLRILLENGGDFPHVVEPGGQGLVAVSHLHVVVRLHVDKERGVDVEGLAYQEGIFDGDGTFAVEHFVDDGVGDARHVRQLALGDAAGLDFVFYHFARMGGDEGGEVVGYHIVLGSGSVYHVWLFIMVRQFGDVADGCYVLPFEGFFSEFDAILVVHPHRGIAFLVAGQVLVVQRVQTGQIKHVVHVFHHVDHLDITNYYFGLEEVFFVGSPPVNI